MTEKIPQHFPFRPTDPAGDVELIAKRRNAETLVVAKHWQNIADSLNYLYGRRKRVYPTLPIDSVRCDDLELIGVIAKIYVEPGVDNLIAYVKATCTTNEYYFGLDLGGALTWFYFPSDGGSLTVSGVIEVPAAGWCDLTATADTGAPLDQAEIKGISIRAEPIEEY